MNLKYLILVLLCSMSSVQASVKTEIIEYNVAGVTMKGYLAFDDAVTTKRPGVLVVHEWWGHDEYAQKRARMLATLGYVAFALDMYGAGKKADHPKTAGKFSGQVMAKLDVAQARF